MKELSIEEKAKRYDEAISIAREYDFSLTGVCAGDVIQDIFPELKESDDERIKKELIAMVKLSCTNGDDADKKIAWLEKQGDQKPADKVEPKFKVGQIIKKEGFNLGFTIVKIEDCFYYNDMGDYFPFTDQDNWELVEQKPAWSEEDEKAINDIMWIIEAYRKNGFNETHVQIADSSENWLKSLRPQNRWKPSDEQMEAIKDAIEFLGCTKKVREDLKSLYEQLKKLREE